MKHIKTHSRGRRRCRRHRISCACHRHFRRRRDVPLSDLRQMGGRLQEGDRQRAELPVDRLRRRHQADHRQDRDFRRLRHAAEGRAAREGRPRPVPDGDGRRRAGRQCRGHQARRARARRRRRSAKIFLGKIKTLERSGDQEAERRASSCRRSRSSSCTARTARAPPSLFTDYLSKVSAEWKSKVGANTAVEWPVGIGAKGNEGVANNVGQTKGSIGYVEYAYAKQNKLTNTKLVNKDGKAVAPTAEAFQAAAANADWEGTPGFGVVLTNEPGAEVLADRGRDLHPDAQAAAGSGRGRARRSSSSTGPMPRATRWPRTSTTCRCRTRSSARSRSRGRADQGHGRQAAARDVELTMCRKRRRHGAFSLSTAAINATCRARGGRLSGFRKRRSGSPDAARREATSG